MTDPFRAITVATDRHGDTSILYADGLLDSSTYRELRDAVIKAALDEPRAVIVDVNRLAVPSTSAWSVFTSARWHVNIWPDVPIVLVCGDIAVPSDDRFVRYHQVRTGAPDPRRGPGRNRRLVLNARRRGRAQLPGNPAGIRVARAVVHEWLTAWSVARLIPAASTVATVFVENVLEHTDSAPVLIVENFKDAVTIAVEDCSQFLGDPARGA